MQSDLRRHHMIQPPLGMTDVDNGVGSIIDYGFLFHSHTQCAVHNACASLWREQLDGAECARSAEGVAARDAAPQHHVHTSENLPWELRSGRGFQLQALDQLVKEMSVNRMWLSLSHLVPVVRGHFHLHFASRSYLTKRDEIVERCLSGAFHLEKP